jgi:hypothetical protein
VSHRAKHNHAAVPYVEHDFVVCEYEELRLRVIDQVLDIVLHGLQLQIGRACEQLQNARTAAGATTATTASASIGSRGHVVCERFVASGSAQRLELCRQCSAIVSIERDARLFGY